MVKIVMAASPLPLDSDALRANIAGTAQEVTIPDDYRSLLDAVAGYHGVREPLQETLTEYFHGFRNVGAVIDGLQTTLLRNWSYFERSPDRARLFSLLAGLAIDLLDAPLSDEQASSLLRQLFIWSAAAARGAYGLEYDDALTHMGATLCRHFDKRGVAFLERDRLLRDLLNALPPGSSAAGDFSRLYAGVVQAGHRRVTERLDVIAWARNPDTRLTDPGELARHFATFAPETPAGGPASEGGPSSAGGPASAAAPASAGAPTSATAPEQVSDRDTLLALPGYSDLIDDALGAVFRIKDIEDRFMVCLFFLKDDTLGYRQHEVMVDLLAVVKGLMDPSRHTDFHRLLELLTEFFHQREGLYPEMRFQCYEAVGTAIGGAGAIRAADHLIDDLLSWRFQYPDIRGATDEWQTVVNPFHLPNIRCWMQIVESNPAVYERLAAALNVQLRLGGVFINDTDLFQRDVSRFLAADIRPIYFVAKQLLRTFPVYFNEVGAEGELRSVSTEVDELCGRQDTLLHFLRKQSHAESSNRLVDFSRAVLDYWRTLDASGLSPYLSENTLAAVGAQRAWAEGPHRMLAGGDSVATTAAAGTPDRRNVAGAQPTAAPGATQVTTVPTEAGEADQPSAAAATTCLGDAQSARRVELLVRLHELLAEKYSFSTGDLAARVKSHLQLTAETRGAFGAALDLWRAAETGSAGRRAETPAAARDALLDAALTVLEELRALILTPGPTAEVENIYHKRHIAAGIPSMYGTYSEPRFDALGLSFRVERLVARLLDDAASAVEGPEGYLTRATLRRMSATMRRFERALAVDGVHSQNLSGNLRLLEASAEHATFTFHQYQNVFQFMAAAISELSRLSVLSHDQALRTILACDPRQCGYRALAPDAVAEIVLREVLVSALGLQTFDRYLAAGLRQVTALADRLAPDDLTRMMNYDPDRLVSWIHEPEPDTDDQITLGSKALGLKHLAEYGHRVPEGFILTTELYTALPAMSYRPLYDDTIARLREAVTRLEHATGLRLGDPERPLLLSIRSGAAISLPGLMVTFINVGLNDALAESLARLPGWGWTAWDSYRRFLQSWAMSGGVDRDVFDDLMTCFKSRFGVIHKADFSPEQMREIALAYKTRARGLGVVFIDDPFRQVVMCARRVLTSWDAPQARTYRDYLGVAEEWGTAVIVQRMVFGNRGDGSGAGVTFTRNPLEPHSRQVRLFGDYGVRTQGEDLVGGLVFPLPISEAQRLGSPTYREVTRSLEHDFPDVYAALLAVAEDLVRARDYDPQEIEFTFESPDPGDLHILQKRTMVQGYLEEMPVFDTVGCAQCDLPVAVGMGVAGGAYAGRVAVDAGQIDALLAEDPDQPVVLLRPDTVPEDITMIVRVQGILTARGGATSHAAVTAKRLHKTAVADCRALEVREAEGTARLAGHELHAGDWLSLDGRTGRIFLGRLPILTPTPRPADVAAGDPAHTPRKEPRA